MFKNINVAEYKVKIFVLRNLKKNFCIINCKKLRTIRKSEVKKDLSKFLKYFHNQKIL